MMKKRFVPLALLSAAALALTGCASSSDGGTDEEKTFKLKLASYQPPGAAEAVATGKWAEQIEEATDGRVKIEFFFQEGLLPGAETLQGVGDGRADLGYIADAYYPSELPLTNIAGLPFATSSPEAQGNAFKELYEQNEQLRQEWENQGVHVLIWAPVPPNTVALKEPAEKLADLDGRKIRAIGFSAEAFQEAGMTPVAISQSEVYESLQRGVIDGTSGGSFDILTDRDYQEVAPHFVDLRSGNYALTMNVINKRLWDSMPKDIQDAITEVSDGYLDTYLETLYEHEDAACTKLIDAGGTMTVLDEKEAASWADRTKDQVKASWKKAVDSSPSGADADAFYDEYMTALEKFEADASYEPALQRCATR